MSILIKGVEMPVSCAGCPCANDESRFCHAAIKYIPMLGRPDFCPLAEVEERKKGEWVIHETETDRYDDMKCPFCKKSYTVDAYRIDDIGFTAADFNYCPNCGADMRGKQE